MYVCPCPGWMDSMCAKCDGCVGCTVVRRIVLMCTCVCRIVFECIYGMQNLVSILHSARHKSKNQAAHGVREGRRENFDPARNVVSGLATAPATCAIIIIFYASGLADDVHNNVYTYMQFVRRWLAKMMTMDLPMGLFGLELHARIQSIHT